MSTRQLVHSGAKKVPSLSIATPRTTLPKAAPKKRANLTDSDLTSGDQAGKGFDDFDIRHNINGNVLFELPFDAEKDFNSYRSARPYLEVYSDLPFGILGSIAVGYEFRDYGGKFPWTGQGREDRQFAVAVSGIFRNLTYKGIAPQLEYRYTNNSSNIGLYDYDSHAVNLYFTKKY